ncbi:MAG: hypothetical protein HY689_01925 [Chloroflexi bacterium]|nr:hypothetical protein [Chloroflexota bacterium]
MVGAHGRALALKDLNRYDRATVALWRRGHAELPQREPSRHLAEAAVHALLTGLRRCADAGALFARYETDTNADFVLISSLLAGRLNQDRLWRVRDAAFYLRWLELLGDAG